MKHKYFKDAGAIYDIDKSNATGTIQIDFEVITKEAQTADFWFVSIGQEKTLRKNDVVEWDRLHENIKPLKKGNILYCNSLAVDYFGRGVMEPHIILKDFVHFFKGDVDADYKPKYIKKING